MFDQLFGSKTRVKLLSLFLNNPGRAYYVREITRKIDEQINSVRRELANLLSIGIVKSDGANNRLYYEVNEKYEHYKELRAIFSSIPVKNKAFKETKEEEQIAKKLRTTGTVDLAYLTGFFVRDNHVKVDLLVVGDINRTKLSKVVAELEQDLHHEINYAVLSPDEYDYRVSLNDRFLSMVLDAKRIVVVDRSNKDNEQPLSHTDLDLEEEPEKVVEPVAVKLEVSGE